MDWRNRSFTAVEDREHYEVFARRGGYIGHESLCETPHRTLLDACACAGISPCSGCPLSRIAPDTTGCLRLRRHTQYGLGPGAVSKID